MVILFFINYLMVNIFYTWKIIINKNKLSQIFKNLSLRLKESLNKFSLIFKFSNFQYKDLWLTLKMRAFKM